MGHRKYYKPEGKIDRFFWYCGQIIGACIMVPTVYVIAIPCYLYDRYINGNKLARL